MYHVGSYPTGSAGSAVFRSEAAINPPALLKRGVPPDPTSYKALEGEAKKDFSLSFSGQDWSSNSNFEAYRALINHVLLGHS